MKLSWCRFSQKAVAVLYVRDPTLGFRFVEKNGRFEDRKQTENLIVCTGC